MSTLLQVEHLQIALKQEKKVLVQEVSFSLEAGNSLVLLGQSGSGKTMTCHWIMGLLDPKSFGTQGRLIFQGRDLTKLSPKEKRGVYGGAITMIPQNPMSAFDPSMKMGKQMRETLALHSSLRGNAGLQKVKESLLAAGLPQPDRILESYPHMLSGGMLQRCMIALSFMTDSKLIVADEPTTALDAVHRKEMIQTLQDLKGRGTAVLLVTHDFAVARQMAGELLIMKDGRILERGSTREILEHPQASYTRALLGAARLSGYRDAGREE